MTRISAKVSWPLLVSLFVVVLIPSAAEGSDFPSSLKRVKQTMVAPPALPDHSQVASGEPVIIEVRFVIEEKQIEVEPGATIWALTFGGTVPGPMIVAHQNDYIELTLVNPSTNTLTHNIDFHAATGALGGGALTKVAPGEEVVLRFKVVKPGVFVYHCAVGGAMVPLHVVSGMNGAIMVLPREGLSDEKGNPVRYDRAFYIVEQDYYLPRDENGLYKSYSKPATGFGDMSEVMRGLIPTHVVFNGSVGALTGENAMTASVGEKVLFIHSQANRDTRPHLIGGHGDLVWQGGSFADTPVTNQETWFVPGGTAVAMLYEFRQPGLYAYLNHNLIVAFMLGAVAHVNVEGTWDNNLMKQVKPPSPIEE